MSEDVAEKWKCTKSRKQLVVALINCQGDKASLQHKYAACVFACVFVCVQCAVSMQTCTQLISQDAFNQRMEIVIRNIKEGKVVIDSGFYSEAAMKAELKFDK